MKVTALLVGLFLVLGLALSGAQAGPTGPATHLGQPVANHVTLMNKPKEYPTIKFYRVLPDGSTATAPFTIPSTQRLIITDVSWSVQNSTYAGKLVYMSLAVSNIATPTKSYPVFGSSMTLGPAGFGTKNDFMLAGFVVAPGAQILVLGPSGSMVKPQAVILRGYLVPQ